VDTRRWHVSIGGGRRPLWARNGREPFYRGPDRALVAVRVENVDGAEAGADFSWGAPVTIVPSRSYFFFSVGLLGRTYDVSPDGQRFLMIKESGPGGDAARPNIVIVKNWVEELKRLVLPN
jgi:hypothetical protein